MAATNYAFHSTLFHGSRNDQAVPQECLNSEEFISSSSRRILTVHSATGQPSGTVDLETKSSQSSFSFKGVSSTSAFFATNDHMPVEFGDPAGNAQGPPSFGVSRRPNSSAASYLNETTFVPLSFTHPSSWCHSITLGPSASSQDNDNSGPSARLSSSRKDHHTETYTPQHYLDLIHKSKAQPSPTHMKAHKSRQAKRKRDTDDDPGINPTALLHEPAEPPQSMPQTKRKESIQLALPRVAQSALLAHNDTVSKYQYIPFNNQFVVSSSTPIAYAPGPLKAETRVEVAPQASKETPEPKLRRIHDKVAAVSMPACTVRPGALRGNKPAKRPQYISLPTLPDLEKAQTTAVVGSGIALINNSSQRTTPLGEITYYDPSDPLAVPIPPGSILALYLDTLPGLVEDSTSASKGKSKDLKLKKSQKTRYRCAYIDPVIKAKCRAGFRSVEYWRRHFCHVHVQTEYQAIMATALTIENAIALKDPKASVSQIRCCFCPWESVVGDRLDMTWPRHLESKHRSAIQGLTDNQRDNNEPPRKKTSPDNSTK